LEKRRTNSCKVRDLIARLGIGRLGALPGLNRGQHEII